MYLLASKFAPLLFYPLSLIFFLLIATLLTKKKQVRRGFILVSLVIVFVSGNDYFSDWLVKSLEWRYLPKDSYPQVDAIVVLGGGTNPALYPRPTPEISGAGDRVLYGARLYKEGLAPVIVLTGGNLPWRDIQETPAESMLDLMNLLEIPTEDILLEGNSSNTYENALFTWQLLEPLGIKNIILVTSAIHMPRSLPLFENLGFNVIPAPTDYSVTRNDGNKTILETWPDFVLNMFPSTYSMSSTTIALKEYFGIGMYWARGWW